MYNKYKILYIPFVLSYKLFSVKMLILKIFQVKRNSSRTSLKTLTWIKSSNSCMSSHATYPSHLGPLRDLSSSLLSKRSEIKNKHVEFRSVWKPLIRTENKHCSWRQISESLWLVFVLTYNVIWFHMPYEIIYSIYGQICVIIFYLVL